MEVNAYSNPSDFVATARLRANPLGIVERLKKQTSKKATVGDVLRIMQGTSESKYQIQVLNSTVDTTGFTTGQPLEISNPQVGTSDTQRIGDSIWIRDVELRMSCQHGDVTNVMRLIVFRWLPVSSTAPYVVDILSQNGTIPSSVFQVLSPYNKDNLSQFEVYLDTTFQMNPSFNPVYSVILKIGKPIQFVNGTTNGSGKLFAIAVSDSNAATHPSIQLVTQCNFTDG